MASLLEVVAVSLHTYSGIIQPYSVDPTLVSVARVSGGDGIKYPPLNMTSPPSKMSDNIL